MLGAIIGDIAGSTYEFHNTNDYNCNLFPKGSNYTDDTVMTMAVASWLLKATVEDFAVGSSTRKTVCRIIPGAMVQRCA